MPYLTQTGTATVRSRPPFPRRSTITQRPSQAPTRQIACKDLRQKMCQTTHHFDFAVILFMRVSNSALFSNFRASAAHRPL
jgi:hypothetical protein